MSKLDFKRDLLHLSWKEQQIAAWYEEAWYASGQGL